MCQEGEAKHACLLHALLARWLLHHSVHRKKRSTVGILCERDSLRVLFQGPVFPPRLLFGPIQMFKHWRHRERGLWLGKIEDGGFYGCLFAEYLGG